MRKILVAPSLLSADFGNLAKEIKSLEEAGADILHLDLMDGHYVPNLSFGHPIVKRVRELSKLPLDAHLMVSNPDTYIDRLADAGVQMVSFHQECCHHTHRLLQTIKAKGMKCGLALNPATPLNTLDGILPELDYVLLMSVNPGFSGQSFIPSVLPKVRALKGMIQSTGLSTLIEVDGGVSDANSVLLADAGVDILVSASYIFASADYQAAINALRNGHSDQ